MCIYIYIYRAISILYCGQDVADGRAAVRDLSWGGLPPPQTPPKSRPPASPKTVKKHSQKTLPKNDLKTAPKAKKDNFLTKNIFVHISGEKMTIFDEK